MEVKRYRRVRLNTRRDNKNTLRELHIYVAMLELILESARTLLEARILFVMATGGILEPA